MENLNVSLSQAEKPEIEIEGYNGEKTRIINTEDEKFLDESISNMLDFMRTKHSQEVSNEEKDNLYGQLQNTWKEVSGKSGRINEISFSLLMHKKEKDYLYNLVKNDFTYDADNIFYGLELIDMMDNISIASKGSAPDVLVSYNMTTVDLHYLYHILKDHKVKGLGQKSQLFALIIQRIALSSKVFNYYKNRLDDLSKAIQVWVSSLDEGVTISEDDAIYQLIWGSSDIKPNFITSVSTDDIGTSVETDGAE